MYQIKLTPYAQIFYNEWLLKPNDQRYNVSMDQTLYGKLDINRLRQALKKYIKHHILLNSHIKNINNESYWVKNSCIHELEYSANAVSYEDLLDYVCKSFDLHKGPLYRFKLIRITTETYRFITVFHHLLIDGSSLDVGFFKKVSNYYNNKIYKELISHSKQIKLIKKLNRELLIEKNKNEINNTLFWSDKLSNIDSLDLSFLRNIKNSKSLAEIPQNSSISEIRFSFEKIKLPNLHRITHKYEISAYLYSQCVFATLLYRYTGHESFAINYPIAIKEGIDFIYGAQINTNIIPYLFNKGTTIIDLFNQAREFFILTKSSKLRHGYFPIADILKSCNNNKLLNISFIKTSFRDNPFDFTGITKSVASAELNIDSVPLDTLLFELESTEVNMNYRIRFNEIFFDKRSINYFIDNFKSLFLTILEGLTSNIFNQPINDYNFIPENQYNIINRNLSVLKIDRSKKLSIHSIFEEKAKKFPERIAVLSMNVTLTYKTLNEKSNQLANFILKKHNPHPEDTIIILLDKSEQIIIAILATLKLGAAYVPITPDTPKVRLKNIINDSDAKIIITNCKYQHNIIFADISIITLDNLNTQFNLAKEQKSNLNIATSNTNLAYVIYTSGSTGNPKGVLQQHNSVIDLFFSTKSLFNFSEKDIWILFHSYTFDFSVWEIFGALLHGAKLIIPTLEQTKDPAKIYQLCQEEKVTIFNQTPVAFYQFIRIAELHFSRNKLSYLRLIILGGDKLNFKNLAPWLKLYKPPELKLVNMYGITETTVHATYKLIHENDIGEISSIGNALPNKCLYILDNFFKQLPLGAVGELYIGGNGLARGYLNQFEMTKEKFIPNPFLTSVEEKIRYNNLLYKTGDLVRILPNNEIEYIGRNDRQVKLMGHRIELNEIEAKIMSYPSIQEAIVIIKKQDNSLDNSFKKTYLIAYYTASKKLDNKKLKKYLESQLPKYMWPCLNIQLPSFPLNINGKIDLKLLPEPKVTNIYRRIVYNSPQTSQEEIICNLFSKILDIKEISVNDDFFNLGGNSIDAIHLTLTLNFQHDFGISVSDIFTHSTPKKLAILYKLSSNITEKLAQIKLLFKQQNLLSHNKSVKQKKQTYIKFETKKLFSFTTKSITNVLLTGSTGFLGCNILNQILKHTNYNILLLIRKKQNFSAFERLNANFKYYFSSSLDSFLNIRIFTINADLEQDKLGLKPDEYHNLIDTVDSIVHAAALVKHYGKYKHFYSKNVQATINLLELAKLTLSKDFHYISTFSIFNSNTHEDFAKTSYNESSSSNDLTWNNFYIMTKAESERQVFLYQENGLNCNIYRVGNLAYISDNFRFQKNLKENAFFNWLKFLLEIGYVTKDIKEVQISSVDMTALAIVKLFDKQQLSNNIYHVFNPHLADLSRVNLGNKVLMKSLTMESFIDVITNCLKTSALQTSLQRFLMHQGWLNDQHLDLSFKNISQKKTENILKLLNFEWLSVNQSIFHKYYEIIMSNRESL